MKLSIEGELPGRMDILNSGYAVPVARRGVTWRHSCLGKMSNERGVYVIHHDGKIKYVGKTDGAAMTFGKRLRREFQETASQNRHIYRHLSKLKVPPDIMVCCYPTDQIKNWMQVRKDSNVGALRFDYLAIVFELVMIVHLDPDFQQQFLDSYANYIHRRGRAPEMILALKASLGMS